MLMISNTGRLFSQTAPSACECLSFTYFGETGVKTPISGIDPIPDCSSFTGILVIDVPTVWSNLSIQMEAGSSIEVRDLFTVAESNIGTCDVLWQGIYTVGDVNFVVIEDSEISGANIAVRLNDQATYQIHDSKFVNNYIGISTGSPFESVPDNITVYPSQIDILGCEFYTADNLPPPYPGHIYYPSWPSNPAIPYNQGYAAFYIAGSTGLNIGKLGASSGERNKIYNMRNGVVTISASTWILGTDFADFEGTIPRIAAYNNPTFYNQRGVSLEGSFVHMEQNTFDNLMIGVNSIRSSQVIVDNNFEIPALSPITATRGIDLSQPTKAFVENNDIYNGFMGITVNGSWNGGLTIENNRLYRSLTAKNNVGINLQRIYGVAPANVVQENVIEITGGQMAVGISMNDVRELRLWHNTIDFLQTELLPAGTENAGISGMQVYSSLLAENYITGTANYKSGEKNAGIVMTNSMDNRLNCNETDEMFYGHWYIGSNIETDLKSNEFYDATHGLDLFSPVTMMPVELGTQDHFANKWLGTFSAYGAYISGPDPDNTALNSTFIADDSDIPPGGVLIPSTIGPMSILGDWFKDQDGITSGVQCTDYGDLPLADTLSYIIRHGFEFTDYEDEMNWMSKADILTFLYMYPSYLSNTVLDSFFDAEFATSLGELIWAEYQIGKIHGIDAGMDEKDTLTFDYLSQIRILDSLIALNPLNISALKALRVLKIDTLSEHFGDWLGMLESQITDTETEIINALDVIDNVIPSNDLESQLQVVLLLGGDRSLGDSLTTLELSDVYSLARQCPWMGARSLSEAQILYSQIADSIFTHRPGFCSELESFMLEERSDESGIINDLSVYPNPASDLINVTLPFWAESLTILSADGREWKKIKTNDGNLFKIDITDTPSGIYSIRIQGGKNSETHQFIVFK